MKKIKGCIIASLFTVFVVLAITAIGQTNNQKTNTLKTVETTAETTQETVQESSIVESSSVVDNLPIESFSNTPPELIGDTTENSVAPVEEEYIEHNEKEVWISPETAEVEQELIPQEKESITNSISIADAENIIKVFLSIQNNQNMMLISNDVGDAFLIEVREVFSTHTSLFGIYAVNKQNGDVLQQF